MTKKKQDSAENNDTGKYGLTQAKIAKNLSAGHDFEITRHTIANWMKKHHFP